MNNEIIMPLLTIDRHRLMTDGTGVTTLVASYGCPLSCKYCLNPYTWAPEVAIKSKKVTPKELYEKVKNDNIDVLINNAGFGLVSEFKNSNLDKELEMIDLNVKSLHTLTKLFYKDFIT